MNPSFTTSITVLSLGFVHSVPGENKLLISRDVFPLKVTFILCLFKYLKYVYTLHLYFEVFMILCCFSCRLKIRQILRCANF